MRLSGRFIFCIGKAISCWYYRLRLITGRPIDVCVDVRRRDIQNYGAPAANQVLDRRRAFLTIT